MGLFVQGHGLSLCQREAAQDVPLLLCGKNKCTTYAPKRLAIIKPQTEQACPTKRGF